MSNIGKPVMIIIGVLAVLLILLGMQGTLNGNWQVIAQSLAPFAVIVSLIGGMVWMVSRR